MRKKICVIGLGYVGFPLASLTAIKGYKVIGFDIEQAIIKKLSIGQSHIRDDVVEELFDKALISGNFSVTSNESDISDCDTYIICVPTPIDSNNEPDLIPLFSSLDILTKYLQDGDLVIVESTVFPGTCEEILIPKIEQATGKNVSNAIHIAHCPERVNPGDSFWTSENIPRVVGSNSEYGLDEAAKFYSSILGGPIYEVSEVRSRLRPKFSKGENGDLITKTLPLGSVIKMKTIKDAEAVKNMENTVRDINIAFVNELAKISDHLNVDVVDIIDGMSTKPFGKGPFFPGAGVGGHCIAVDPEWLDTASKNAGYNPEMIRIARSMNSSMPEYLVSLLEANLEEVSISLDGASIAVLGVAYKANVDDSRESPFFRVKELLLAKGANLNIYDSWVKSENTVDSIQLAIHKSQAIVIVTDHSDMINFLNSFEFTSANIKVIIDGRNALDSKVIKDFGILYHGIGRK